ncbi:MAG: hypothetical protein JRI45_11620 [Deltaproteobacteria bacterium]|nr:hypothetical protein [Deltaproteobacteria bacterium]
MSEIKLKKQQIEKLLSTSEEWIETPHIGELGVSFTDLAPLDRKYFDLKAQLDSLVQIFTPEARDVKALKERIQHLRQQKADSLINILNIEEANIEDQKNNFESQVLRLQNQLKELVKRQLKYEQLQRQRKLYEDNYLLYKRKLEELRIASELDRWKIASVQVINPAIPPIDPVWPKKKLILMIIGILSLLFGIAMAFFKEMVSTKVDRGSDLEVLDIKHLATVPELKLLKGK